MSEPELLYEVKGNAAWITLNRESRRNALSPEMMNLFHEYLDKVEADGNVRVLCITGAGEKAFCSGADLAASFQGDEVAEGARKYARLLDKMAKLSKPIVARVNGHCMAGGMGLLLSSDIAYAREGTRFGTPELNVGLFPMMIGALIFRNVSRRQALEMIYTARTLSAEEAEEMGLVTRVLPADGLDGKVRETLDAIASKAPLALEIGRRALAEAQDLPLGEALEMLAEKLVEVVSTEDAKEGLTAFMQKRKPEWKRR